MPPPTAQSIAQWEKYITVDPVNNFSCMFPTFCILLQFRSKKKKRVAEDLDVDTTPSKEKRGKIGKPKIIYGVDNAKFVGAKAKSDTIVAISRTISETEFDRREEVFSKHRPQIQEQLRFELFFISDEFKLNYH